MTIKYCLQWIGVNGLFLAFFLFTDSLPAFLLTGGLILFWMWLAVALLLQVLTILVLLVDPDSDFVEAMAEKTYVKRPRWFYVLDGTYDLILFFVIVEAGFVYFAIAYALTVMAFYTAKIMVNAALAYPQVEEYKPQFKNIPQEDIPEWMRD